MLEYFFNMPVVFEHVFWVDEYIIQIDFNTDIQKVRENAIYELLKRYESISKTEGHYKPLEWSIKCPKSGLLFITISYVNQVVSMAKMTEVNTEM